MEASTESAVPTPAPLAWRALLVLAAAVFLVRAVVAATGGYGWFIDELYYASCARRPALGYVDHPPLAMWILAGLDVFGESLVAMRAWTGLLGAVFAVLGGWLAARLGGGRYAQILAALCVALMPGAGVLLGFYSMNALEFVLWGLLLGVAVRLLQEEDAGLWVLFGVVGGVGLMTKHTIALLAATILLGFLATRSRRLLASRWLWIGGGVALLLALPNLVWQATHDWASLTFYVEQTEKNVPTGPVLVLFKQVFFAGPLALPVWGAGLVWLLRTPRFRALGLVWPLLAAFLVWTGISRPDRITGVYVLLFAAGGVAVETWARHRAVRGAVLALAVVGGAALLPVGLPILSQSAMARYLAPLGPVLQVERGPEAALPQWYADRLGWDEEVRVLREVVATLTPEEREHAVVLAPSYGHASAVEILADDLPPPICRDQTWRMWSEQLLRDHPPEVVISMDYGPEFLGPLFREVEQVATLRCAGCREWRRDVPVYVARGRDRSRYPDLPGYWRHQVELDRLRETAGRHYLAGDYAAFLEVTERVVADSDRDVDRYNLACGYALAGREDDALRELSTLAEGGWRSDLMADSDFTSLHGDPRFEALVFALAP